MSSEHENYYLEEEEVNRHSSIYDSNIGLPVFPSEFKYMPESNYEILATLTTSDDVEKFISLYSHNSCSEWRVLRTYTRVPPTILYKRAWRCQYNVQQRARVKDINRIKVSKNCHCPGYICITLYSSSAKRGFEEDFKYKDYRARIKLNLDHNHDLNSREALQKRTLDPNIKDKIVGMFQYGHGASTSIKVHLLDLLMINEEQYFNLIHNGSYMPSVSQVQHYLNHYKKEMELLDLNDIVEEYLLANPEARVKHFCIHSEDNKVVNIITPLMLKVHQHIPRSGEVITVSISEKINRLGTKLLTLTTHWDLGPLPLGLIVLQQNDTKIGTVKGNIIAEALTEFALSTASENFFYGQKYPKVIITEGDLVPLVSGVWTKSLVLASQSSVLKSVWTWLQDSSNNINFSEREGFYYTFKKILFSSSAEETQKHFSELSTFCVDACPSYLKYVVSLMLYQHLWLNYHRKEKLKKLHLSHIELETSSHVEILSAYVYHQMLMKIKNLFLNLPEVLDFVLNHLESYYYVRMLKLLNDSYPRSMMSKYLETEEEPEEFALQPSDYDKDCYFVMSGDVYHYVDYKHKLCSTNMKNASSPCAHINAVLNYKMETSVLSEQDVEVNERVRELCKLLLSDHYSNLRTDERSVIVINTDTRRLICESSYVNQTETGNVAEIVIETHVEDDENPEHDVQYSHVIDSHVTELIHQEETETISSDEVEIVTVSCSDFNEDKTQMGMQMNLEACSKFIRNTLLEATEEGEIQIVEEDNAPNVTKPTDIKQKPPDEMPGQSLKRKLNSRESTSNVDMAISSSKLIAVQIPGSTSKLVNLKSIVDQCPQRVSVQDLLRNEDSIAETVNLKVELESKSIIPQNSEVASQNQRIVINQKTGIVQVVGNESNRVLTVPRLSTQRSVFSLSDNVIIIDPHVKKETGVSNAKKFVDSESELKKFNEICERIKQNPSQYKTVMRNMIDVYETFYGD